MSQLAKLCKSGPSTQSLTSKYLNILTSKQFKEKYPQDKIDACILIDGACWFEEYSYETDLFAAFATWMYTVITQLRHFNNYKRILTFFFIGQRVQPRKFAFLQAIQYSFNVFIQLSGIQEDFYHAVSHVADCKCRCDIGREPQESHIDASIIAAINYLPGHILLFTRDGDLAGPIKAARTNKLAHILTFSRDDLDADLNKLVHGSIILNKSEHLKSIKLLVQHLDTEQRKAKFKYSYKPKDNHISNKYTDIDVSTTILNNLSKVTSPEKEIASIYGNSKEISPMETNNPTDLPYWNSIFEVLSQLSPGTNINSDTN